MAAGLLFQLTEMLLVLWARDHYGKPTLIDGWVQHENEAAVEELSRLSSRGEVTVSRAQFARSPPCSGLTLSQSRFAGLRRGIDVLL